MSWTSPENRQKNSKLSIKYYQTIIWSIHFLFYLCTYENLSSSKKAAASDGDFIFVDHKNKKKVINPQCFENKRQKKVWSYTYQN